MYDSAGLLALEPAECLRLLRSVPVGRIVFTHDALPAIQPVNFALHGDTVVIRTGEGRKLSVAADGVIVAFEADEIDVANRRGWSVTAVGKAAVVTDPAELAELAELGLAPWVPGDRSSYIRIQIERLTGRRIDYAGEPTPDE